jgi:DNA-binding SARP family transcriptional activator
LELKISENIDYITTLLKTRLSSMAEEKLKELAIHSDPGIRKKVWEIRRAIHRSKVPRLRIETLGGFQVFRGDSSLEEKDWDRNQPKKLLKAIISHGNQRIPKEILMEDLWPEENPEAAERNFKTPLQRLRKSLEPAIHEEFGSSYVHLHDNFVILDHELCQVDVDLFLSLLKKGDEKEKEGDIKSALSFYDKAIEIYKGDFLPEELYAPWVDAKREELTGKYIEILNRLANLHERQGSLGKAIACHKKAIQADPLSDESCQRLMTLYYNRGMVNEALRAYEACRKALETGLNTNPDPTTTALYKKILENLHAA